MNKGDVVRARENIQLESGSVLRAGHVAVVEVALPDDPTAVGVKWHDRDGDHVAAIATAKLEPDPRCDHCGLLGWTRAVDGKVSHKHDCPHRDEWCQAHPLGCDVGGDQRGMSRSTLEPGEPYQ